MKVIRIEHPSDGKGYFRSLDDKNDLRNFNHSRFDQISDRHNSYKFPTYWGDWDLQEQRIDDERDLDEYNFAYNSLDQLASGFTRDEIKECIEKLGFRVLMYTLDKDYFQSEFQVIFIKSSAVSVEDVSSLFL